MLFLDKYLQAHKTLENVYHKNIQNQILYGIPRRVKKLRRKLRVGKQCNIVIEPHPLFFPHTGPLVKAVWYCTENRIDCKYGIKYQSGQDKPDICAFFHFLSHLSTRPFKLLPR